MDAPEDRVGAINRFREGPARLEAAVLGLPDDVLDFVPGGGGWTIRQIVHHVVDGDDIWKLGIKLAMGAYSAHREQPDRSIVNGWIGHRERTAGPVWGRSGATLV